MPMTDKELVEKRSLSEEELQLKMKEMVPDWRLAKTEKGLNCIERVKHAQTFMDGIEFVRRVAEKAEHNNHHPDIHINYKRITIRFWTHSSGGVTLADLQMARKTDPLF